MIREHNFDHVLERLRERATEDRCGVYGYCQHCEAGLTQSDVEDGYCSQCNRNIDDIDDENHDDDESRDEHLWED